MSLSTQGLMWLALRKRRSVKPVTLQLNQLHARPEKALSDPGVDQLLLGCDLEPWVRKNPLHALKGIGLWDGGPRNLLTLPGQKAVDHRGRRNRFYDSMTEATLLGGYRVTFSDKTKAVGNQRKIKGI